MKGRLEQGLELLELEISEGAQQRLLSFIDLLRKWNRVYNLTAIRDEQQMITRHLLDSLVLLPQLDLSARRSESVRAVDSPQPRDHDRSTKAETPPGMDQTVSKRLLVASETRDECLLKAVGDSSSPPFDLLDVGSGAGLPVIPLAIVRPDLRCLSVEANGKKARFQRQVAVELGLPNLTVLEQRVEDCHERAVTVTSRAFTAPREFLTLAARHCAPDGQCIVMLGQADRLPDPLPHPFELLQLVAIELPGVDARRHLAICRRRNE